MVRDNEQNNENKEIVLYYAGLDDESLPFGEGLSLIRNSVKQQVVYLKALSLVADIIVIPPSFYFVWSSFHKDDTLLTEVAEMYKAGILQSHIHRSMNFGTDFLEHKLEQADDLERKIILEHYQRLTFLFRIIPVIHRSISAQRSGFKELLSNEIASFPSSLRPSDRIIRVITEDLYTEGR